jgi:Domain of unknown function (DUF1998)
MAGYSKSGNKKALRRADGQIRQSQMVSTFGPGAMVDFINRSVVIGGLEHWGFPKEGFVALDDARLRRSLIPRLKSLDPNLDLAQTGYFRMAPESDDREPDLRVGARALEFPRWFVCQGCRRLARAAEAFEGKGERYRHECSSNRFSHAVPVRFVAACKRGHLADFPWIAFVHPDGTCDRHELYLKEGATGDVARIIVECRSCGSARPLSQAAVLPFDCSGDRPWLGGRAANEPCSEKMKMLVRTASNAYFAQVVSALRLPEPDPDPLTIKLRERDVWKAVQKVTTVEQLQLLASLQDVVASAIAGANLATVLKAIEAERGAGQDTAERPLRSAEYARLINARDETPGLLAPQGSQFVAYRVPPARAKLPTGVSRLVIVPELREVRVQVSFSRFDSVSANLQGEYDFDRYAVTPAALTLPTGNEKWLPAAEVRGEGVFIELDAKLVQVWEQRTPVQERAEKLLRAFEADGNDASLFPGIRFYLLHSLSHLLLTAISLECGYAASAIRERIYCAPEEGAVPGMAGLLLSTGTTGSEGTLGGLVEEGRRIRGHLREAWDLGRLCSNDPVCAGHDPSQDTDDRRLEGAACHGCLYIAECSCERFNRYLDRALVVPTIGNDPDLAFFKDRP